MKRKFYFYSLLMAIVMMAFSPTVAWAQDDESGEEEQEQEHVCSFVSDGNSQEPTCTEAGYEEGQTCSECGASMPGATIPATGHSGAIEPSDPGFHHMVCSTCGAELTRENCTYNSKGYCTVCDSQCEGSDVTVTINGYSTPYNDIQAALADAKAAPSATLTLLQDVNLEGTRLTFDAGNVTLDLNGYTLEAVYRTIYINGASLTITDTSVGGNGEVISTNGNALNIGEGSLCIKDGTFISKGTTALFIGESGNITVSLQGGRFITESEDDEIPAIMTNGLSALADGYAYYNPTTGQQLHEAYGVVCDENGNYAKDVTVKAAAPEVPTFDSLEELIAANQDYDAVNVTVDDVVAYAMPDPNIDNTFIVIVRLSDAIVGLISASPESALNWESGGRVTGTLTNVKWDNLDHILSSETAFWSALNYTEPDLKNLPTYSSIADLLADENLASGTNVTVTVSGKIAMAEYEEDNSYLIKLDNGFTIGAMGWVTSDPGWAVGGTISGTLQNVNFVRGEGEEGEEIGAVYSRAKNIFAPGADLEYTAPVVASVTIGETTTGYADIQQALAAAKAASSATLTLLQDVTVQGTSLSFNAGNVTLDLNGKTIAIESAESPVLNISAGSLIITDSGENGEMKNTTGSFALTVTGGNLTIHGGTFTSSFYTLDISGGTASLDGGKYISTSYGPAISNTTGSSILAEGYLFYSITADNELTENTDGYIMSGYGPASQIIVKAAPAAPAVPTFASLDKLFEANLEDGTIVTVTVNGTIASTSYDSDREEYTVFLDNDVMIGSANVSSDLGWVAGGTVSGTLTNVIFVKDNVMAPGVVSETTNIFAPGAGLNYTAPGPVASVTINGVETTYTNIWEALDAAIDGAKTSTLKLLDDVEISTGLPCLDGHDMTIDLNNHTYTATLGEYSYFAFEIYDDAKLTVKNGKIISNKNAFEVSQYESSLNINNCTVEAYRTGIYVDKPNGVVNIVNTNIHSEINRALYTNGIVNMSGNCRLSNNADEDGDYILGVDGGSINIDPGYKIVDHNGTSINFSEGVYYGTPGQYLAVVADPDVAPECAAGTHTMEHCDAVPATCATTGKAEYWHCTTCQRHYADAEGNTKLPFGIIPDTPASHNYVDGVCTKCGLPLSVEPVMVTEENFASLGLKAEHVGYYAIQNLANLAYFAEGLGSHIVPATEPKVGEENGGGVVEAPRRANKVNGNSKQINTRRNAVRKAPAEQGDVLGFVLTADIVVNANLLDANGMPKDRDNNGNIRADLLAWEPVDLDCGEYSELIFDGNGHAISGLYQNTPTENGLGFIYDAYEGVTIRNLGITDSYFGSIMEGFGSTIGSIVCYSNANIENCWSDATIDIQNPRDAYIGGLVGEHYAGNISNSYFSGKIMASGVSEVSGLVSDIYCHDDVTISNCHFSGSISCKPGDLDYYEVSGLVDYISAGGNNCNIVIERCYADGKIDAEGSEAIASGLFTTLNANGGTAIVCNNYNAMTVNAPSYYGLFYSAQGNGNISFNVNADKNAFSPYSNAYISGDSNISVADEENVYDGGFVFDVTEEQMASGAVAYRLNMLNEMMNPGEIVIPGEKEPVVPRAPRRAAAEETAPVWYQLIGEDAHPVLAGDEYSIVYCDDEEPTPASVFYNLARTLDSYDLVDTEKYAFKSKTNVAELTYTRTFGGTNWTTWYVPFDLVLTDEICAKLAFSRINNVHQYDDDEDGNADRTVIESFRQKAGVTLKANYPYLVKALDESALSFELELNDVELAPAKENSIDCQSVDYLYTFTGTYTGMDDSGSESYSLFDDEDDNSWLHFYSLEPQRHYMTITSRNGGNGAGPAHVKLRVIGDEDATGIVTIYSDEQQRDGAYDLMGRKININSKQPGLRIVNGKKELVK